MVIQFLYTSILGFKSGLQCYSSTSIPISFSIFCADQSYLLWAWISLMKYSKGTCIETCHLFSFVFPTPFLCFSVQIHLFDFKNAPFIHLLRTRDYICLDTLANLHARVDSKAYIFLFSSYLFLTLHVDNISTL